MQKSFLRAYTLIIIQIWTFIPPMSKKGKKIRITFSLLSQISFILWVVTFLFFLFLVSSNYESNKILSNLIFPVILFGVLTFTLGFTFLFLSKADNKKSQKKENKITTKNIENETPKKFLIILLALVILFSAFLYVRAEKNEKELRNKNFKSNLKPTPTALQPTPTLKPVAKKNVAPITTPKSEEPWGVAKQIDEVTWTMKVGQDERIGTPQEIYESLNVYRQRHGKGILAWDQNLAEFAQQRAIYFDSIKNIDKHVGFKEYTNNIENLKKLGFWSVGENCNYGQRLIGVHLIEWIYAGDKPHDDNQLNPLWTHVGVGIEGLGVAIIFGADKI